MASQKLLNVSSGESEEGKMDMSPMIDMVFLLLIFFMVASTLIVNRLDPFVKPPIADNAITTKNAIGRIVINVYSDAAIKEREAKDPDYKGGAKFTTEMDEPLADELAITDFVLGEVEKLKLIHPEAKPKILLRGDKRAQVLASKQVAKAAGQAGVIDIVFATYQVDTGK